MAHAQPQHATSESTIRALDIEAARRAEYVAFLSRHPFATDAHELGFVTGIREDCRLQIDHLRNVDVPLGMLDNDFHRPDLERYLETFRTYEPEIGVIGDAPTPEAAYRFVDAARDLKADYPDATLIIVPKCRGAIDIIGDAEIPGTPLVLGYSMGYSDILADDFSEVADWRGQRVHLLGASPPKQWAVIQQLTQPTLAGDPPADIIGLDWNGAHKVAYNGEFWSRDGWQRADHLSIRSTVRRSLREMRSYWEAPGVWPIRPTLRERHGTAVREPDDAVWAATGGDISEPDPLSGPDEWETRVDFDDDETYPIEHAIVVTYEDGRTLAYRSQTERDYVEYYEGLWNSVAEERV
ncbi:DUF6610 family protein [Haloplanus halophilus]|uniref:DUF6610 family protein n=1 Tax=Haloplanus halophilus TaxID=2949993 RepID=UPI00203F4252|nr:DUF6610 family protein [Haloplanus sp. GDY1]